MTAVLVDDDELNNELLANLLKKYCPTVKIAGSANSVEEALEIIINNKPDLLFLDIELNSLTAKDLLNYINLDQIQVIIISAYEKYALEMHKFPVTDYLLKPLAITDLIAATAKAQKIFEKIKQKETAVFHPELDQYIALPEKDYLNITKTEEIVRLEANGNYTKIVTKNEKLIVSTKSIGDYELLLPKQKFLRVHNSHIVNIQYVDKYLRSKSGVLVLLDGTEIPISANRKKEVTERIVF